MRFFADLSASSPPRRPAALLFLAAAAVLSACGGSGAGADTPAPQPVPPRPNLALALPGVLPVKLRSEGDTWVVLAEKPHGFMDETIMERRLRISDANGADAHEWTPPAGWTLVDFALHPQREISAVLSNGVTLRLVRLDSQGRQLAMQDFRDQNLAQDPYFGRPGEVRDRAAMAPLKTRDAVRIAPSGEHLGLALRSGGNGVVAYRFDYTGGRFAQRWRTLVEPGIYLDGIRPRSGSYDPFEGSDNHWKLVMDMDARGRMAVGVLVSSRSDLAFAHRQTFDEPLPAGFADGVLLTVLDERGMRSRALAIDNRDKSEVHALKWAGETLLVAGRVRTTRASDGSGWDGYVARTDGAAALRSYRLVDVDRGDAILDLMPLDGNAVLLAGASGYTQNPDGESVSETSAPLLARLDTGTGATTRIALPAGPRGNQVRGLAAYRARWLAAGMQNVPGTHSADSDPRLLVTDGWLREVEPAR
ncbi:hypothetical protein QPK31_09900 [Massilia sp. YIM B02769]|nr:hypothetical protein [Massilia sp. YIM B02769]